MAPNPVGVAAGGDMVLCPRGLRDSFNINWKSTGLLHLRNDTVRLPAAAFSSAMASTCPTADGQDRSEEAIDSFRDGR